MSSAVIQSQRERRQRRSLPNAGREVERCATVPFISRIPSGREARVCTRGEESGLRKIHDVLRVAPKAAYSCPLLRDFPLYRP